MKFLMLLVVYLSFSLNCNADDFYIPTTISDEAKNILKTFKKDFRVSQEYPSSDDIKGWEKIKNKFITYTKKYNEETLEKFKPKIERYKLNGVPVVDIKPNNWKKSENLIIYIHGGGFTLFDAGSSLYNSVPLADYSGIRIISVDYTTAPKKKWPGILNEIEQVIEGLYKKGYESSSIGVVGDSAGGSLATALILKLINHGKKYPETLVLWSPWVDISKTGDTYFTLSHAEPTFSYEYFLKSSANAYAEPTEHKHKYVSPVYANYNNNFPATLIQGGTKELLLSNFVRLFQKMDQSGVNVKLDLYEGMWHVFQSHYNTEESKIAITKTAHFFKKNLNNGSGGSIGLTLALCLLLILIVYRAKTRPNK